ncbi:hypothetical protein BCR33DRAFT_711888 [Rhizoclosmatium globosum]|uniref:RecA family profile 1 domain-containing protein n=1 Tax=Rhizoclosmatium globosum TaxID=329046 RepID=A0A1Y2D215_9FUNG|nr:hypothetical protein BCR33DRAFT_711888 [Rhizoclosmatium globosum]|eukprot:ORY52625.1 hypothetical protein BCR33DRAFT_711888 [Rhizoclosmatium globosum]
MAATYSALSSVIRNDHELMVTAETYILERVPGLSEEALREIKLEAARNQLNVPMMSGLEAVESEAARWHVVSSGCPGIDQLLQYRGFATGTITEFAGMSATGKTQLAFFSILTSLCLVPQSTALFVDSNCSFSIERIKTLFEKSDRFHAAREQGMTAEHILSRLKVSHCYDAHQLLDLLTSLQWSLYNQTGEFEGQLKFLIIDSVGSLLAPVVGLPGQQAFLSSVGVVLDAISSYGIPVVVCAFEISLSC